MSLTEAAVEAAKFLGTFLVAWIAFRGQKTESAATTEVAEINSTAEIVGGWKLLVDSLKETNVELTARIDRLEDEAARDAAYRRYVDSEIGDHRAWARTHGAPRPKLMTYGEWVAVN